MSPEGVPIPDEVMTRVLGELDQIHAEWERICPLPPADTELTPEQALEVSENETDWQLEYRILIQANPEAEAADKVDLDRKLAAVYDRIALHELRNRMHDTSKLIDPEQ